MCEKIFLFITVEVISSSFILMTGKGRGKTPSHWTIKPESASVSRSVTSCWVCSSHISFGQLLLPHWTVSVASQAQRWPTPWVSFSGEFLYDGWLLNPHWGSFKGRLIWGAFVCITHWGQWRLAHQEGVSQSCGENTGSTAWRLNCGFSSAAL